MKRIVIFILIAGFAIPGFSQKEVGRFTLNEVLRLAKDQSPDAILARHRFRASYWQHRSFQAAYLPSLRFDGTLPRIDRSIRKNTKQEVASDGSTNFVDQYSEYKSNSYSGVLSLGQNIGLTGGKLSINSSLERNDQFGESSTIQYLANPVINIRLDQPLFGYNSMKWDRKVQPLVYEQAKKNYIDALESVSLKAIGRFFDLASAQMNLRIARVNFSNSDTLYKIAQGRYNIGTIAENDVLQMQLSYLNAKTALRNAETDLEVQKQRLRSFLGFNEKMDFDLVLPDSITNLQVDYQNVLDLAMKNNPDMLSREIQRLEAKREVAQAKGQRRDIRLTANYGLSKTTYNDLPPVYQNPGQSQGLSVGIGVPIVDWGQGRGRVKMAESNQELVNVQVQQAQTDFEQSIFLQVMQFNLQNDQVKIAAIADTIGQRRYDVTKQRFLIGKIDVLNLNDALKEKDNAKRGYVNSLREYWTYFFTIRQITLFDFISSQPLNEEYEKLVE